MTETRNASAPAAAAHRHEGPLESTGLLSPGQTASRFPYPWELIVLLWGAFFLHQADRQIFNNLAPLIMKDLGLTKIEFGIIGTVFTIVYGLMVPMAGYAGDALRRKWVILGSLLVFSSATLLTGSCGGLISLILFRSVATGGGEAFYYPAANSLIGQFHSRTRAMAMAIHQTALYVGIVCSSFAASIGLYAGWRNAFYLFGTLGLLMAAIIWRRMRNTPRPASDSSRSEAVPTVGEVLQHVAHKPSVWFFSVAFAGMVFVNVGYLTWTPTFLAERYGLALDTASFWALFSHHAAAFLGVTLGGRFSDTWAQRRRYVRIEVEYIGLLLGAPFILWTGLASGPATCCIALAGFGFFRGVYDSNLFAAPFDVIEPRYRSSAVGLMLSCAFVVGASASTLLAWIAQRMDLSIAIASMSGVYVISGLVLVAARHTIFPRDFTTD
jgi:sugar phosphate permease